MAKTKQFTIAVDNQPGAVAGIAKTLGNAKVNILSLLGTAQGTAGTVQVVVDDARRAKKALDAARIAYAETPAEQGYVYLPGKSDEWWTLNVRTIFRGVEGNWFHAWSAWERVVRPLIEKAELTDSVERR